MPLCRDDAAMGPASFCGCANEWSEPWSVDCAEFVTSVVMRGAGLCALRLQAADTAQATTMPHTQILFFSGDANNVFISFLLDLWACRSRERTSEHYGLDDGADRCRIYAQSSGAQAARRARRQLVLADGLRETTLCPLHRRKYDFKVVGWLEFGLGEEGSEGGRWPNRGLIWPLNRRTIPVRAPRRPWTGR